MSDLSKQVPNLQRRMPEFEARARAALVAVEKREADAAKNIRAIGKDPECMPESVAELDVASLYGTGRRTERRQILLRHAVQYLFNIHMDDEREQDRVIARLGARTKLMVDWMIGSWESVLRPKTWMDSLNGEQQKEWAVAKKRYDRAIEHENQRMAKARAEYDKIVREVHVAQATAREELRATLREFGMREAPLLEEPDENQGTLKMIEELKQLGVNFRPPDELKI